MQGLSRYFDRFDAYLGRAVAWLVLPMVLIQFALVLSRYVFGISTIWMQESVLYLHAFSFMLGAAAVLLRDRHVRIDLFYGGMSNRQRALVDLAGIAVFLLPAMGLVLAVNLPTAIDAWAVLQGSAESGGIPGIFLLKSLPVVMALLLILQGFSITVRAVLALRGDLDCHISGEASAKP